MRLVIATLALSLAAPAFAAPAAPAIPGSFVRDGAHYQYTSAEKANGIFVIDGRVIDTGMDFALTVDAGHVTGSMGGNPVDFMVSKETMTALTADATTIASN